MTSVTIYAPSLESYGSKTFRNHAEGLKIYVLCDCVGTYKAKAEQLAVDEDDILPIESISLKDNGDNSTLIAAVDGYPLDVTLQGRRVKNLRKGGLYIINGRKVVIK